MTRLQRNSVTTFLFSGSTTHRVPVTMEPPLPVMFFNLVASLKDKSPKGYPVKKVGARECDYLDLIDAQLALCLWKSLLACFGGLRELNRVKALTRELAGLPSLEKDELSVKSTAVDVEIFRQETSVKYPTYYSPQPQRHPATQSAAIQAAISKLARSELPLSGRPSYNRTVESKDPISKSLFVHHFSSMISSECATARGDSISHFSSSQSPSSVSQTQKAAVPNRSVSTIPFPIQYKGAGCGPICDSGSGSSVW